MKLAFIGPQGCGKGTQAKVIASNLDLVHISTGDLLRSVTGQLKSELDEYMNKGALVPDTLILKILKERLSQSDCIKGFILDGFPRNISQAKALEEITKIDNFIEISISDEESIKRISGRRSCPQCQKIYNIFTSPKPSSENSCDECSVALNQRSDDTAEAVKKRLEIYHAETEPILKSYPSIKINGEKDILEVTNEILESLK